MYTEYVFENKKYEVALREMKATLFDIVSFEENNIEKLREKAFSGQQIASQEELQALFVKQDACLREVLAVSKKLEKALKDVDSCSRELKSIEDKGLAQIVARVYGGEEETVNRSKPKKLHPKVEDNSVPEIVASTPVDTPQVEEIHDEGDKLAKRVAEEQKAIDVADDSKASGNNGVVEDPVMEYDESLSTVQVETPQTDAPQVEEKKDVPAVVEDPVMEYDESLSTVQVETPQTEAPQVEEKKDAPAVVEDPVMEYDESLSTVQTEAPQEEANKEDAKVEEAVLVAEQPSEEKTEEPSKTEDTSGVIPVIVESKTEENIEEAAPVLQPVIPTESTTDTTTESDPVIVPSATTDTAVESNPVIPTVTVSSSLELEDEVNVETIAFKKRSNDEAKVIMVSKKQATNLRSSLPTQEALLNAKGFFQSELSDVVPTNNEVISTGMFDGGDATVTPEQVEQLMNQANELYAAGKVEEAQKMFDQVSELNKKLQGESVGIVKK